MRQIPCPPCTRHPCELDIAVAPFVPTHPCRQHLQEHTTGTVYSIHAHPWTPGTLVDVDSNRLLHVLFAYNTNHGIFAKCPCLHSIESSSNAENKAYDNKNIDHTTTSLHEICNSQKCPFSCSVTPGVIEGPSFFGGRYWPLFWQLGR